MKQLNEILNSRKWRPPTNPFVGLPIRPKGKETRLWIDNEYFEKGYAFKLPKSVTLVYAALARHANADTQICWPSAAKIRELTGIKNRQTIADAVRILEAHNIIAVIHSKGRVSNQYALLDTKVWNPANSNIIDTVRTTRRHRDTVQKTDTQQYQLTPPNSITDDTRIHIRESDKEVKEEINKEEKKTEATKGEIPRYFLIMLDGYFEKADSLAAYSELQQGGVVNPTLSEIKNLLREWSCDGKIKEIKPMAW